MITATIDINSRDPRLGDTEFDKLEFLLMLAYHVCKDIDSTDCYNKWPDEIREYVAQGYNAIQAFNNDSLWRRLYKRGADDDLKGLAKWECER